MKEVYLLSGLGADKRVFDFLDFSDYQVRHIEWISPNENESIESYAQRLSDQIQNQKPILIGVSFGGMMAVEIAKLREPEKVILISSAKTKHDIPMLYWLAGMSNIVKILPGSLFKKVNSLTYWFFGAHGTIEQAMLRKIISDTDDTFLKWAINQITNWKNETIIRNTFLIHGNQDRILPNKKPDFIIEKGGHLMITNRPAEINSIIRKLIG
ncbi:MAG TPA: alpha/beta hydrolase [Cyclobacteriaceae bacterium]|nr:alpha/beta hydrolase [Cyclobacteriaceae bacterium]